MNKKISRLPKKNLVVWKILLTFATRNKEQKDMKPLITNIINNGNGTKTYTLQKQLYYVDVYYITPDGDMCGDLGYEANKADTRNEDSLEENIKNLLYGIECMKEDGDIDDDTQVWEIHRATFQIVTEVADDEYSSLDEMLREEWGDVFADILIETDEVVYETRIEPSIA